ncbi:MAG: efflux RND transporter periplasmic adaptor subunit [Anaerolineae bacterium]
MNKVWKIGGIVLIALALVGLGALFVQRSNQSAVAAEPSTVVVSRGSIEETTSATGNVIADQQATLAFASSGEIAEVLASEGQIVEAGQALARLDTTSLEWQVARSQASLDTAQARLEQAQQPASAQDIASAQAALDSAQSNYDKVKAGASAEDIASAQAALDSAQTNYDKVKAGPTEEDLAAAKAQLDSAKASVQQAQAAYDRIKDRPDAQMRQESLNLQNATISLEQARANYDAVANRPTASELASAEAQVAQAEASLASLLERPTENELASAASQVAQAEASLASLLERPRSEDVAIYQAQAQEAAIALAQAQDQLEDATLTAPFTGKILEISVREGEWANPGAPALAIAATKPLILDVNVDEVDVAQLAEGQGAHLSFDALRGEVVDGTVTYIASSSTNVGGAVAYEVEVGFDPGDLPVRLGMTADVDIVVASAEDALLVPNQAIEADRSAGRYFVTRQTPSGEIQRVEVRIGSRDESNTEITEGLEEGDVVVLPQVPEQNSDERSFGPGGGEGMPFGRGNG